MSLGLALGTGLVDLAGVVALTLVRIPDDVVSGVDLLEAALGLGLTRIEIRMRFLGGLAVGLADVVLGGAGRDAQDLIGIGHAVSRQDPGVARSRREHLGRLRHCPRSHQRQSDRRRGREPTSATSY